MGGNPVNHVNVNFKRLHTRAFAPKYASHEAAGADLYWVGPIQGKTWYLRPGERRLFMTGISIELDPGYEAQIRPRSGLALRSGITVLNTPGTIDSDYRGDIGVILYNAGDEEVAINTGDRIAQLVVAPVCRAVFNEGADNLSETDRGKGGFGSTGVKG